MASTAPPSDPYFSEIKKGEVGEIRALLRNPALDRDPQRKREVLKKVIAYMTMGIDMSRLFSDMILATGTGDLVQKKMVYLYLLQYAPMNSELAVLAINTLLKDCVDVDPLVRGLALRNLCSLRVPGVAEYLTKPLQHGLRDPSPYVRKTAVMGCLKLFHLSPASVRDSVIVTRLYETLRDKDPQVITNCVLVLNEILLDEGGMAVNQLIMQHLLGKIRDFSEWGQCAVLELVLKYQPESEDEIYAIMNVLDERLHYPNAGVVMAAARSLLHLCTLAEGLQEEVFADVKEPLYTLLGQASELSYAMLENIRAIAVRHPHIFEKDFKHFFVKQSDPTFCRVAKLAILAEITSEYTYREIVSELSEYAREPSDPEFVRRVVRTIGMLGCRLSASAEFVLGKLLSFLDLGNDAVTAEAISALRDMIRKYPQCCGDVIPSLDKAVSMAREDESKCAIIWILGEFALDIPSSPYMLENYADRYEEEKSATVKLALLSAIVKCFFARPAEARPVLQQVLTAAIADISNQDVHDRALLYYRLLCADVNEARKVITSSQNAAVSIFIEDADNTIKEEVYKELNTLAVIYNKPAALFMGPPPVPKYSQEGSRVTAPQMEMSSGGSNDHESVASSEATNPSGFNLAPSASQLVDFMTEVIPPIDLQVRTPLTPAEFQGKWGALKDSGNLQATTGVPCNTAAVNAALTSRNVRIIASGGTGGTLKIYAYSQTQSTGSYHLIELIVNQTNSLLITRVRSEDPQETPRFLELFKQIMACSST